MQVAAVSAALLAALQRERQAGGAGSQPTDTLADLLARVAAGAGGSAAAADVQQRADVMFLGFLFLGVLVRCWCTTCACGCMGCMHAVMHSNAGGSVLTVLACLQRTG